MNNFVDIVDNSSEQFNYLSVWLSVAGVGGVKKANKEVDGGE